MAKDMKKKCLECGHPGLYARVSITRMVPLADRHGTIKIGGLKVGQADLKTAWDKVVPQNDAPDQTIRGPIFCAECETEHYYVVGHKNPLRVGSVVEARERGYDQLMAE